MLVCEIPNIVMQFWSAIVWADQLNLPWSNWQRSLRMRRRPTKVQEGFRCKWRARRSSIQIIPVQNWPLFSILPKMNLNMSVLIRWSGCWMPILFINQQMTLFQATRIQFQACPEPNVRHTRSGPFGWLWEGGFGILICQGQRWWMKWVLTRLSPQWQHRWYANCWRRKL